MQRQSFLASNVYAGQHSKPQLWVRNPTLFPRTGLLHWFRDRNSQLLHPTGNSTLVLLTGKATLLPTLFFALHKQDSASGSFKLRFVWNLHSVSVVHFALIGANWRISSILRGFGLLGFAFHTFGLMCIGDLWNFLDLLHRFHKSPQLVLMQLLQCSIAHRAPSKTVSFF